jgi:hypothetical protein
VLYDRNTEQMTPKTFDVRWWNAAGGSLSEGSSAMFAWPLANLPLFSQQEQMATEWTTAYSQAMKLYARFPGEDSSADDLAYWYVCYHHTLWHTRESAQGWKTGVNQDDWSANVRHLLKSSLTAASRDRPYVEWACALPLLAAPESGLSPEAASAILAGTTLDDVKCKHLRDIRLSRARTCLPGQDPEETLAKIDATYSQHPWIELVENAPDAGMASK